MKGQVELICRTLCTIAHLLMVHVRVLEAYIDFTFIYTTDHIFLDLLIRDMINKNVQPNTPFKLATGTKTSVSHSRVLFFHVL